MWLLYNSLTVFSVSPCTFLFAVLSRGSCCVLITRTRTEEPNLITGFALCTLYQNSEAALCVSLIRVARQCLKLKSLYQYNGNGIEFVNIQEILERFTQVNLPIQIGNLMIFKLDEQNKV